MSGGARVAGICAAGRAAGERLAEKRVGDVAAEPETAERALDGLGAFLEIARVCWNMVQVSVLACQAGEVGAARVRRARPSTLFGWSR